MATLNELKEHLEKVVAGDKSLIEKEFKELFPKLANKE